MSSSIKGKIALVTGASSGIGYEIAKTLARAGVRTIGAARNFEKLRQLESELKSENIENFIPMQMDIVNKNDVFSCLENIHSMAGPVEILINNAGIMEYCKMMNCDLDLWLDMVNVNCIGFLNVVAATLPHMKELKCGHIVNITSDAGTKAFPGLAVYSGTKFFLEAVSDAMRQEITSNNIKVSCVEPGDVQSGLHQKSRDKTIMKEYTTDFEYLKVKDIADTVLFVLSQSSNCAINKVLIQPLMGAI